MSENKSEIIDLNIKDSLLLYRKKWYWFVISVVACVSVALLATLFIKPKYTVKANVALIEEPSISQFMGGGLSGITQLFGGNASGEDEITILTSNTVVREVVNDLGLNISYFDHPLPLVNLRRNSEIPIELTPVESTVSLDTLRQRLLFKIKLKGDKATVAAYTKKGDEIFEPADVTLPARIKTTYGTFDLSTTEFYKPGKTQKLRVKVTSPILAAEDLREVIDVELVSKNSQIIQLSMVTENEDYAIDVLNTLIKRYAESTSDFKDLQYGATARFIDERIGLVKDNLNTLEGSIKSFKSSEGLGMVEADGTVMYERMAETEKALTEQEVLTEVARITLQLARESAKDNSLIPPVTNNENIAGMIDSYNTMLMRRLSVVSSAKPDNVGLKRLDEQIEAVRNSLIAALETAVESSKDIENQFRKVYEKAKGHITGIPGMEYDLRKIERDREIEEQIYVFLLQKQEEVNVLFNNKTSNIRIIDQAYSLCEDDSISTMVLVILAIAFGLIIPPTWFALVTLIRMPNRSDNED